MSSNKKYWKSVEELKENSSIVEKLKQTEFVEDIQCMNQIFEMLENCVCFFNILEITLHISIIAWSRFCEKRGSLMSPSQCDYLSVGL